MDGYCNGNPIIANINALTCLWGDITMNFISAIISIIVSITGLVVGIKISLYIMAIANIDPMSLWIPLTIGAGILCAFVTTLQHHNRSDNSNNSVHTSLDKV